MIAEVLAQLADGRDLESTAMAAVVEAMLGGTATAAQIGGLLMALRVKGESVQEIVGAARAVRDRSVRVRCPDPERAVDTCGTGGDGKNSINVSTVAALVAAACGVRVAKHGNRSVSSRSGSADVLEALGVRVDPPLSVVERCLAQEGIGFLFTQSFHGADRRFARARRELGTRTLFNLIGPLTNPARVGNQLVGVFDGRWCEPIAQALGRLGARRAIVVHGSGGFDEVAVRGPTQVAEWSGTRVECYRLEPADFGLAETDPRELAGGDAAENAAAARRILDGQPGAPRNAVVMSAALALVAAGRASSPRHAARRAAAVLDDGSASRVLERLAHASHDRGHDA